MISGVSSVTNSVDCEWILAPRGAQQIILSLNPSSMSGIKPVISVTIFQCTSIDCESQQLLQSVRNSADGIVQISTGFIKLAYENKQNYGLGFTATWNSVLSFCYARFLFTTPSCSHCLYHPWAKLGSLLFLSSQKHGQRVYAVCVEKCSNLVVQTI